MKKVLVVDGNAIMHRAYHALPPLTNTEGVVINAVYGFLSMLLTVMGEMKPEYLIVCFDRPKPTFRQGLYAGYQQHRPKMADDLSGQFGIIHEILEKMRVSIFEVDGYEADDLIGTIAYQVTHFQKTRKTQNVGESESQRVGKSEGQKVGESEDLEEVVILSGDRDLLQLVNGGVRVLAPVVGVKNTVLYDEQKVVEKYGIEPKQIVDYKALVGDASDGYPGVAGIGPKTASGLLQRFGTLEGIYEHLGELEEKLRMKLAEGSESAGLCKQLATIVIDAPITLHLEECAVDRVDRRGLRDAFALQGFKSLLVRAEGVFAASNAVSSKEATSDVASVENIKEKDGQMGLLD